MNQATSSGEGNPLGMWELEDGGPFVLPPQSCSERRQEFFRRANRILGTYAATTLYAGVGQTSLERSAEAHGIRDKTPMRIPMGRVTIQWPYRVLRSTFASAGDELTNQAFLMIYGNFEAYLADLVYDALASSHAKAPFDDALRLMASMKWWGKLDRIGQRFDLRLGRARYRKAYEGIEMGFLGREMSDPIDFLEAMAEMRHRLVHSAGRVDANLRTKYPGYDLPEGALIRLPPELPFDIQLFLVPLTDLLDDAFCTRFGWKRRCVHVERLVS